MFNASNENFQKGMGEVLKFATSDRGLRKKTQKFFSGFAKIAQF